MRALKFRGLDNNGIWDYLYMRKLNFIGGENVIFYSWHVKPETIGQYTGLNDKNGKEIYEGDIVRYGCAHIDYVDTLIVTWCQEYLCFCLSDLNLNNQRYTRSFDKASLEVIGNIYENPGLLEKTYSIREVIKVAEEKLKEDEAFISSIKDKYKI